MTPWLPFSDAFDRDPDLGTGSGVVMSWDMGDSQGLLRPRPPRRLAGSGGR